MSYRADANPAGGLGGFRSTQIKIRWPAPTAGQNVFVSQAGDCTVSASKASGPGSQTGDTLTVGAAGGSFHFYVLTEPFMSCPWSVTTDAAWLTIDFPRGRMWVGDGDLYFAVPANSSGQSRQGVLTLGDFRLKVVQNGR